MKKTILLFLPIYLFAFDPYKSTNSKNFDTSVYDTKASKENMQATKNIKIKCRYVCDKKVYKEQKISEAIEFYKRTRNY